VTEGPEGLGWDPGLLALEDLQAHVACTEGVLSMDLAARYAAATSSDPGKYRNGSLVPPLSAFVVAWGAGEELIAGLVPPESRNRMLHAEHELELLGVLRPDSRLCTEARFEGLTAGATGTRLWISLESRDDSGTPVVRQHLTAFVVGTVGTTTVGVPHAYPYLKAGMRSEPIGRWSKVLGEDETRAYAHASGDFNLIHLDPDAARAAGHSGVIAHGMHVFAIGAETVLDLATSLGPARVRRLGMRMSSTVEPGSEVQVEVRRILDAQPHDRAAYSFEIGANGRNVLTRGWIEIER
jgi:acyl dehydratase